MAVVPGALGGQHSRLLWPTGLRAAGTPRESLRIERVIAVSRLFLTVIAFVAFNIGSVEPTSNGTASYVLFVVFTAHSISALLVLRTRQRTTPAFALTVHTVDLLAAAITLPMAGSNNPFFTFFLFVLAAAAFRWGLRETVATTLVAVALVLLYARLAAAVPLVASLGGPGDFTVVVVRAAYLAMMGLLLGLLAEEGHLVRAESAVIVGLLGKIQIDAGLTRALNIVANEMVTVFNASRVLLAVEDVETHRLFRWDTSGKWSVGPSLAPGELPTAERFHYLFGKPGQSFSAVRRWERTPSASPYRITEIDGNGRGNEATWIIPTAFAALHPFKKVISAPIRFGDDWSGRIFVFDPKLDVRLVSLTLFLETLVRQVGPAVFSVYLWDRLKTRAGAIERARVARELHDGVIQSLISVDLQLEVLRNGPTLRESPVAPDLARIQRLVKDEVLNLRDLMQQMRPDEFNPEDMLDYLADMVQRFGRDTGLNARFSTELKDVDLSRAACYELVRIVQEGLVNVRKHSAATTVRVRFGIRDGFWMLEIQDDGRGFPFEGPLCWSDLDARHVGPAIIKERVRAIGGQLVIHSTPGQGARLEVLVPQEVRG